MNIFKDNYINVRLDIWVNQIYIIILNFFNFEIVIINKMVQLQQYKFNRKWDFHLIRLFFYVHNENKIANRKKKMK